MGVTLGVHFSTIKDGDFKKCVPDAVYKKFPPAAHKVPGNVVFEITALPKSCYMVQRPTHSYWWTDGQFLPHDDTYLFVTCGSFSPRTNMAWASTKRVPSGRIFRVSLNDGKRLTGTVFRESSMVNYPKVQTHPSGKYIGYVGREAVTITTLEHESLYNKFKDMRFANHKFCAFSPDGKSFAILQSVNRRFELLISATDRPTAFNDTCVDLTSIFPEFKGIMYNEHIECKWSPDSQFIAVCSSTDFLFVLNKQLELVVNVVDHILPDRVFPSWSGTFDYNPQYHHELLAVGANDRCVYVVNTDQSLIVTQTDPLSKDSIDCVQYSPDGSKIAVSFRDFKVLLLDSCSGNTTFKIDMQEQCPSLESSYPAFPSVMRLCFTSRGEHLATSTCDGKVRVWQLPVEFSLFSLCRWALLSHVPILQLRQLPLPPKIINALECLPVSNKNI